MAKAAGCADRIECARCEVLYRRRAGRLRNAENTYLLFCATVLSGSQVGERARQHFSERLPGAHDGRHPGRLRDDAINNCSLRDLLEQGSYG